MKRRMMGQGAVFALAGLLAFGVSAQQRVGQVEFAQGLATAQQQGAAARLITRGDPVLEGDLLTTTDKGYAVLSFNDGTKITLRPATTFAVEKYAHGQGSENAVMRLLKGGLRAITGLIGKRNPGGVQLSTVTATIGIRGTSFDARLCADDCRREQRENRPHPGQGAPVPPADTVVGRVVRMIGEVSATQPGRTSRRLVEGAPLVVGDEVITGGGATVVIAFRDQSKVSLEPRTVFRVDSFSYGRAEQADNFAVRLLKGGLRALTGLIGKRNPAAVSVSTVVATIGVRGTGMDISCEGPCAAVPTPVSDTCKPAKAKGKKPEPQCVDGLFARTWEGRIVAGSGNREVEVGLDKVGFAGADRAPRLLAGVPGFMNQFVSPRPDGVDVDWEKLFGAVPWNAEDGLYALDRDGYIYLGTDGGRLDLGPGEAGVIGGDGIPRRLAPVPSFLADDPFPAPENFDINDPLILQLFGVTMGSPGQEVCEIK